MIIIINVFFSISTLLILSLHQSDLMQISTGLIALSVFLLPFTTMYKSQQIPRYLTISFMCFTFCSITLGNLLGFYNLINWWDLLLHTTSGVLLGLFALQFVAKRHSVNQIDSTITSLIIFSFPLAIGVLWEIFEFSMDYLLKTNLQRSGLVDTMTDLIVATIGAMLAVCIYHMFLKETNEKRCSNT